MATYKTPKLILARITIFSCLFICKPHIKNHGRIANKISTRIVATLGILAIIYAGGSVHGTGKDVPLSIVDTGKRLIGQYPPGIRWSHRYSTGLQLLYVNWRLCDSNFVFRPAMCGWQPGG